MWRYCKAAIGQNNKPKPHIVLVGGQEETHLEGYYVIWSKGQWVRAGQTATDAVNAFKRIQDTAGAEKALQKIGMILPQAEPKQQQGGTPLAAAVKKYFSNLEAQGKDPKTIRAYHSAIDPFVAQCQRNYVEQVGKQDILDFMGWLRRQPVPQRKHGNPERTYANKIGHLAIFLKAFGVSKLLKKTEYPQYEEKAVSAHIDEELEFLYSRADAEQRFLLDFALGSGFRDGEIAHSEYEDLMGNVLEVKRKPHLRWHPKKYHCRKVPVPQALADAIRARRKSGGQTGLIFPNEKGRPDQHLLRKVQALAVDSGFHTELHKLRKTWATRLALAGMPLHVLQDRLGHKSLATTQKYLADVDLSGGQINKVVEAASYVPRARKVAEIWDATCVAQVPPTAKAVVQ